MSTENTNSNPALPYVTLQHNSFDSLLSTVKSIFTESKPVSERRLEANRQNCQKSTGPKTERGKAKSRMNALKNEFTGQKLIMRDDEYIPFFAHIGRMIEDLKPVGAVEEHLAHEIAEHHSRLAMLSAVQINMLNLDTMEVMGDYPANADPYLIEVVGMVESLKTDCAGPKVFDTIGRQEARTTRHMIRLQEMLDRRQDRRLKRAKDVDVFDLNNCRVYQTTMAQLRHYRALAARAEAEQEERENEAARRAAEDAAVLQQEEEAKQDAAQAEAAQLEQTKAISELASFDKKSDAPVAPAASAPAPAPKMAVGSRKARRKGGKKNRR